MNPKVFENGEFVRFKTWNLLLKIINFRAYKIRQLLSKSICKFFTLTKQANLLNSLVAFMLLYFSRLVLFPKNLVEWWHQNRSPKIFKLSITGSCLEHIYIFEGYLNRTCFLSWLGFILEELLNLNILMILFFNLRSFWQILIKNDVHLCGF